MWSYNYHNNYLTHSFPLSFHQLFTLDAALASDSTGEIEAERREALTLHPSAPASTFPVSLPSL